MATVAVPAATIIPTSEYNKESEPPFSLFMHPSDGFLLYKYHLNEAIAADIRLTNSSRSRHTFKVKCTDNLLFRISPPIGFVNAKETVVIRVIMKTAVVQEQYKHFIALYHMKAMDKKNNAKQDADAKSLKKEEEHSSG